MENSGISWTDNTFNPIIGCTKVSPACANCYAERDMDIRLGKAKWGDKGTRVLTVDANWAKPLKWNRDAQSKGIRTRVFCASLSDVFEDWHGPIVNSKGEELRISEDGRITTCIDWTLPLTMSDVRAKLFELIDLTPHLDWLLLTKRPENIRRMWPIARTNLSVLHKTGIGELHRENVWLGTSVENQKYADLRIPQLLECRDLSPVLFLSCEPLLGPLDLMAAEDVYDIAPDGTKLKSRRLFMEVDWVIAGGESGPHARPSHPDWFRGLRDQCKAANVPFHFKQHGEWIDFKADLSRLSVFTSAEFHAFDDETVVYKIGTKKSGRTLDGIEHDDLPRVS